MKYGNVPAAAKRRRDGPPLDDRRVSRLQSGAFPRAADYPALPGEPLLREPAPRKPGFPYTERHVQGVWYDARLRPTVLHTADGERVTVEDPGIWNLEPGPDFVGAVVRVDPGRRRLSGDVEVHIHPSGWTQHGHAADPRYDGVRFHVTYFPGKVKAGELPPGAVQISLKQGLESCPWFSFESVDIAAYPYAARAHRPPCADVFRQWSPDLRGAVLDAAGEERLRRKAERLAARIDEVGRDQTVYEEVLTALGYKHNKSPFRALAERLPLEELRRLGEGDSLLAYALLAGTSGLLPDQLKGNWPEDTRRFMREVWDRWWKLRDAFEARILDRDAWRLAGVRPANHPLRRMRAASLLFGAEAAPTRRLVGAEGMDALGIAHRTLDSLHCPFWSHRLSLGGRRHTQAIALLGASRTRAILTNALVPYLAATGRGAHLQPGYLDSLPREEPNQVVRVAAHQFFGPDHAPSLYRSPLRRQGLLQVFHDYCLNDRSRCAECPFPAALRAYAACRPDPDAR